MKKEIYILLILLVSCLCLFDNVSAITEEEHNATMGVQKIIIPDKISKTGTEIQVTAAVSSNYIMTHQWIKMSSEDIKKMTDLENKMIEQFLKLAEYGITINLTSVEVPKEAEGIYNEYLQTYKDYLGIIPKYNDNNWVNVTDKNIVSYPTDDGPYTLWIKLEDNGEIKYNYQVFENSQTKLDTTDINFEDNSSENNNEVPKEAVVNNKSTVKTNNNPNTGISDIINYLVPLMLLSGAILLINKEFKRTI